MKRQVYFFIIICFFSFSNQKSIIAQVNIPQDNSLHFNFGNTYDKELTNYTNVNTKDFYSSQKGYGFLTKSILPIFHPKKWADLIPLIKTGIKSENEIEFKSKIKPGKYYIEVLMDGGNTGQWRGNINVNGKEILNNLASFTSDPESDEAPDYWSFIRNVKIDSNEFHFSVKAQNQPATLCAIALFPAVKSQIQLIDGKIAADKKFFAPNSKLIIDLLNEGNVEEALRYINAIPEAVFPYQKAKLLFAAAGRLEAKEPHQLIGNALRILKNLQAKKKSAQIELDIKAAELYIYADQTYKSGGWDWAKELTKSGIFNHINFAGMAFKEITELKNHLLQIRANYELAKVEFWIWVEQHVPELLVKADKNFQIVKKYYPNNKLLRMYMGEQIVSVNYPDWDKEIPEWAYLQKKAMDGVLDIIHYWVENRQADNGEFGGKYDDDVEMLRWWPVSRLVVDDSLALLGMKKLVDGIWESKWINNGWSRKLRDVEHSSEPIADTQPMMIGFDYGNPIYVERCMQTLNKVDLWTGINKKGHRHFKSAWYSATAIDTTAPKDCDVEMNTRTVKAINWLAWYNHHPLAMKFLKEWGNSWLEDCMRTDKGKPKGIVPAAVRFKDDAISPYSNNWYNSGMYWRYYNFNDGKKMLDQFLVDYLLFKDPKYLEPIELSLKLAEKYSAKKLSGAEPGSEKWTAGILLKSDGFAEAVEIWRLVTNNSTYDELIKKIGSDYIKFRLTKDEKYILNGLKKIINGSYNNRELMTTEAYFTDRVEIRNLREGPEWGATHLESMYTGSPILDTFFPFNLISWKGFGNEFATIVIDGSSNNLKIKVINISDTTIMGNIIFHQLENGMYRFELGSAENDKTDMGITFEVNKRNTELNISLPPRKEKIINITQVKRYPNENYELADLAITKSELKLNELQNGNVAVSIPVHNIGIKDAKNIEVSIYLNDSSCSKKINSKKIRELKAPLDLIPKIKVIKFVIPKENGTYEIRIDENSKINEITELNNKIDFVIN